MLKFLRARREKKEMELLRVNLRKEIEEVTHNSVYSLEITPDDGTVTAEFLFENGYTVTAVMEKGLNYIVEPELKLKSMKISVKDEQGRNIFVIMNLIEIYRKIVFMPGRESGFYESANKVYGLLAAVQLLPRDIGHLYEIRL